MLKTFNAHLNFIRVNDYVLRPKYKTPLGHMRPTDHRLSKTVDTVDTNGSQFGDTYISVGALWDCWRYMKIISKEGKIAKMVIKITENDKNSNVICINLFYVCDKNITNEAKIMFASFS